MESESLEEITNIFNQIDVEDNPDAEKKEKKYAYVRYQYKGQTKPRRSFPEPVDFEKYVRENCENKFKILDRLTFHQIKRPIIIFFNHFREKCAYHTKWLNIIYQLSIKYGEQIEFIAGDMIDMDVIIPKWDPLSSFSLMGRPEDKFPQIYAIDIKKRIYKHCDEYETAKNYAELCEKLLNGELYPSLPIPENNHKKLLKICVSDNYDDLILNSKKDILLICSLSEFFVEGPDYENLALQLKDHNLDVVYMEVNGNYIPFELEVYCYPTILFIPHNDKNNFICFNECDLEENILAFAKDLIGQPENLKLKQEEQQIKLYRKHQSVVVPEDFEIDFKDLPLYLENNFKNSIKVLERKSVERLHKWILIIYMNFQGKCLAHHIKWLDQIYQVYKSHSYSFSYLIADYKDIDLINSKWKPSDFRTSENSTEEIPKIFAIDYVKHTYECPNFKTQSSLFYFICSLLYGDFYYSQCYNRYQDDLLVKTFVADNFHFLLKQSKMDLFITFYDPDHKESKKLLNILEAIAQVIKNKKLCVEVVKFNAKENYVDLEYAHHTYPVHYFISRHNKKKNILYEDDYFNKEKMLEFIIYCEKSGF